MKRAALFTCFLVVLVAASIRAGQESSSSASDVSTNPPTNPATLTNRQRAEIRADIQMAQKNYENAAASYELLLQNEPKDAELLNKAGIAYQELGNFKVSERYYKKAVRADKKFLSATNNLGTLEYQRKRYGRAISYYKKALKGNEAPSIYSNLGYAYYADKQYPEAIATFNKALSLDPNVFDRKGGVGALIQQRSAPDPGVFYFLLAKSFAKAGDAERTARYLKISRDDGYKEFLSAETDPDFAAVIKDPRVQEVLHVQPSYADDASKASSN
jgi:tetratricopeptide (TPR) repeat protein